MVAARVSPAIVCRFGDVVCRVYDGECQAAVRDQTAIQRYSQLSGLSMTSRDYVSVAKFVAVRKLDSGVADAEQCRGIAQAIWSISETV